MSTVRRNAINPRKSASWARSSSKTADPVRKVMKQTTDLAKSGVRTDSGVWAVISNSHLLSGIKKQSGGISGAAVRGPT